MGTFGRQLGHGLSVPEGQLLLGSEVKCGLDRWIVVLFALVLRLGYLGGSQLLLLVVLKRRWLRLLTSEGDLAG